LDSLTIVLVIAALFAALSLIATGIALERRPQTPTIRALPSGPDSVPVPAHSRSAMHLPHQPAPLLAILETAFWIGVLITLPLHVLGPDDGAVAYANWALTIGPHEIGHVICMPFGWFLHAAGGSIWQVLVFALPALYAFWARRLITESLIFWALTGHSLINLARYIADARARELPLLMGLSNDHHDWWNLLRGVDLLDYDGLLATLSTLTGAGIIVAAAGTGILSAWLLPRVRLGPVPRFEGGFWRAMWEQLKNPS
jgi:hypothetical protein